MNWLQLRHLFRTQFNRIIFLILALVTLSTCAKNKSTKQILFIGNSYTYRNSMPHLFLRIAESRGEKLHVKHVSRGKYTFYLQSKRDLIQKALKYEKWDIIVLQGSSRDLLKDSTRMTNRTFPAIERLLSDFKKRQPQAKVYFYMTWPYKEGYKPDERFASDSLMMAGIESGYANLKQKYKTPVIPVGKVWYAYKQAHPEIDLYVRDKSHPSFEGSYLVSCVMFQALFNKSSIGAEKHRLRDKYISVDIQRFVHREFEKKSIQQWLKVER